MPTTFIYALCEPGTRTVRYIGKTNSLKKRFHRHIKESVKLPTYLGCWIRSLAVCGKIPDLIALREVEGNGSEAEMRYIRLARGCGMALVNATDGGDGVIMSPETRKKIGKALKGHKHSEEAKANMSAAHQGPKYRGINHSQFGIPRSEESKAKMRAAVRPKDSEETKARKSAAIRLSWPLRKMPEFTDGGGI